MCDGRIAFRSGEHELLADERLDDKMFARIRAIDRSHDVAEPESGLDWSMEILLEVVL